MDAPPKKKTPPPAANAAAAAPATQPAAAAEAKEKREDLRHLAAPMSELAAVQMEVASTESKCRKCVRGALAFVRRRPAVAAVSLSPARGRPPPDAPPS
jgi:hypothetical protein